MVTTVPAPPAAPRRRRRVVLPVLVLLVLPVLAVAGYAAFTAVQVLWPRTVDTVGQVRFERPLAVPPLAGSTVEADGTRVFDLRLQTGRRDLSGDGEVETWGVNGDHLAPTLRAVRGERVRVEVANDLPETSSLHWHGMHLPAAADGGPHQMVRPGEGWSPSWTVDQPASTTWYHPHGHGSTAAHVARGVYGMFLVDDPASAPVGLPDTYGVDDVPVMVQDVAFGPDGSFRDRPAGPRPVGRLGDSLLVNGTVGPYLDVVTEAVRLRLLNASEARVYDFALDDGRDVQLVATDGGLLPAAVRTDRVRLSPGERAEVVVRLAPGEDVVLRSLPPDLGVAGTVRGMSGARDSFDVLELRAADRLRPGPALPAVLADRPEVAGATATRSFELQGTEINGLRMEMSRVDATVRVGSTEEWVVRNADGIPHNFHVHGVSFLVGSVDGDPPPARLGGWKDTVYLPPDAEVRLLVPFGEHADPTTPYLFHCHLLAHHDDGMMGQFVVVGPGEAAGAVHDHDHDHGANEAEAGVFPDAAAHDH